MFFCYFCHIVNFSCLSKQVVDARIGPGIKSMTKFKKRMEEQLLQQNGSTEFAGLSNTNAQNIRNNTVTERFGKILKKIRPKKPMLTRSRDENLHPTSPSSSSDNENDENRMSDASDRLECDEQMSPIKGSIPSRHAQRKQKKPMKNRSLARNMSVIDLNVWKKRKACCGVFYEYKQIGAILLESSQFLVNSCSVHCKSLPLVEKSEEWLKLPTAITSLPPKKKHLLRQSMMDAAPVQPMEQSAPIDYSTHTSTQSRPASNLHKVRGDSGKVTKKTPKKKLSDLSAVKNLVKLCTASKLTKSPIDNKYQPLQANEHNENKNITNTATAEPIAVNKFSDNSSDSGYDDLMHDTTQLSQIAQNGAVRPVILSNGIKLHVKPENLLLAANLAGVSQRVIRTTQVSASFFNLLSFVSLLCA